MIEIILGCIVVLALLLLVIVIYHNKFRISIVKIEEAENNIDLHLQKKYDLLKRSRPVVEKELKLEDCINLAGNQDNPYSFVASADLYISSSRVETFGLVMVEALILGIPILAVETSATSTIIDDGKNGIITKNSIDGLYNGLKEHINDNQKLKYLKTNALKYDYQKINEKTIKIIDNILSD